MVYALYIGTVKGVTPQQLEEAGSQLMLGNTYHLENRPGSELVAQLGGLQEFTGWRRPMLTDSGGFQVSNRARALKSVSEVCWKSATQILSEPTDRAASSSRSWAGSR